MLEISEKWNEMLIIPSSFAHISQTLSEIDRDIFQAFQVIMKLLKR
jgi:dTDP-4-dehydrorhamnose 3,5-epimerase-like enzyme